jgi:hypothetical protein
LECLAKFDLLAKCVLQPLHTDDCNKVFKSAVGLSNHNKEHQGQFSYLCQYCGKGFSYKTDYKEHKLKHEASIYKNFHTSHIDIGLGWNVPLSVLLNNAYISIFSHRYHTKMTFACYHIVKNVFSCFLWCENIFHIYYRWTVILPLIRPSNTNQSISHFNFI